MASLGVAAGEIGRGRAGGWVVQLWEAGGDMEVEVEVVRECATTTAEVDTRM